MQILNQFFSKIICDRQFHENGFLNTSVVEVLSVGPQIAHKQHNQAIQLILDNPELSNLTAKEYGLNITKFSPTEMIIERYFNN